MSLAATTGREDQLGNGSVTDFTFTFAIYTKADLAAYLDGVLKTLDTHYQVLTPGGLPFTSLAASSLPSTGKVRVIDGSGNPLAPGNGVKVLLIRNQPVAQGSSYALNEDFPSKRIEKDLDKLAMILQQLREVDGRSFKFLKTSLLKDKEWPDPSGVVQLLAFDGALNPVLIALSTAGLTSVANPMNAEWDLIRGGTAGAPARLAKGADDTVLSMIAGALGFRLIPAASLATDAVETAKIKDGAVITVKIPDGAVTVPKFRRFEGAAENGAPVTVTATATTIATLDLGTVVAGDRIFVQASGTYTKGVTAGKSVLAIGKSSGTATIISHLDKAELEDDENSQAASSSWLPNVMGMFKVTVGGTLILRMFGTSAGSDVDVGLGSGEIYAWVIPGA